MNLGNKILKIRQVALDNFLVELEFQDNKRLTVSLSHLFTRPAGLAIEVLRGGMFEQCFLDNGALARPNGLELCPDTLYQWGLEQKNDSPVESH